MKRYTLLFVVMLIQSMAFSQWTNIWNNNNIYGSCFARNIDTCFVTGSNGKIYRTTNGGLSWDSVQTVFKTSWFLDLEFPSRNIGYACGGTAFGNHKSIIAKTVDGGITWDSIISDLFGYNFHTAFFLNDTVGFFGGDSGILKTINGGKTFTTLPLFTPAIADFFFTSPDTGFFVSGKTIFKSTDEGQTWQMKFSDTTNINSLYFTSSSTGFAVGNKGALLKTSDGGSTWTKNIIAADTIFLNDIQFLNHNVGYIAASKFQVGNGGYIYKTTDGGNSWLLHTVTTLAPLYSISMVGNDTGYAAAYTQVFRNPPVNPTSLAQLREEKNDIEIYPHPAEGYFNLKLNNASQNKHTLHLYDQTGHLVKVLPCARETIIGTEGLSGGVFTLVIEDPTNKALFYKKLVIMK